MDELITSTNHFNKSNEIGSGGYGSVYLANDLRCAGTKAAVEVLTKEKWQMRKSFWHLRKAKMYS